MKKNILKVVFVAMIALAAGYNVYNSHKGEFELSDLMLENMEALAQDEEGNVHTCPGGTVECARVIVGDTTHVFHEKKKES